MPHGKLNNAIYRALLPLGPSPAGHMRHVCEGRLLADFHGYEALLRRHHALGVSLLLRDGERQADVFTSLTGIHARDCGPHTLFRVASLTKMVTATAVLRLRDQGLVDMEAPMSEYLPEAATALPEVTIRHLLSHTSGLRDVPAADEALMNGRPFTEALNAPGCVGARPGETFAYCNLGFGLLGCAIEAVTGRNAAEALHSLVLEPLGMRGSLEGCSLDAETIMPITRVLARHKAPELRITALGSRPLGAPDPLRHYGHTAGALYTDAASLSRLLSMLASGGIHEGRRFLSESSAKEMIRQQADYGRSSPTLAYGLGMLIIRDPALSDGRIIGHQGFAYGCADGAFWEEDTGRQVLFLNGGCSEARAGRLGVANRDVLRWALRKEMAAWK